ncbi:MAG: hypothetical protein ABIX01_10590 [Chitinophagaceae bacterium]
MKYLTIILWLFILTFDAYSQGSDFDMYYPENNLYRKLKVKSELDTIATPAFHHYMKEFDTLGRQISWRYVEDSVVTRFKYSRSGDTLWKMHYYIKNGIEHDIYEVDRFMYNPNGKISVFTNWRKSYYYGDKFTQFRVDKFFYDENHRLTSELNFTNDKYNKPFASSLAIPDSLLELDMVYSYSYDKLNRLAVKKDMISKPDSRSVDSFFYDRNNRIIKIASRKKHGFLGEFGVDNLCRIELISYDTNKKTVTKYSLYNDWEPFQLKETELEINEYIYYSNGLKKIWNLTSGNYKKTMLDYSIYEFY